MLSYLGKVIFSNTSLAVGTISITRYTNPSPNVNFHSMISYSSLSSLKKLYNMILSCYGTSSFCIAKNFPSCEFQLTRRFFLSTIITLTEGLVYIKNEWIYLSIVVGSSVWHWKSECTSPFIKFNKCVTHCAAARISELWTDQVGKLI